jgi:hypothetical protein
VQRLAELIFPYLTTVEGLKLAALSFDKRARSFLDKIDLHRAREQLEGLLKMPRDLSGQRIIQA